MKTTQWWWIRHAPVVGHGGRLYGASDPAVDVTNTVAFEALARLLPADAVWVTSHLRRARLTARAIFEQGLEAPQPIVEPDLAEQHFGEWQGQDYNEVYRMAAVARHKFWYTTASFCPPGGESFAAVCARVAAAVDRLTMTHARRHIVVVAHGGSIRAALAHALGLDPDTALGFQTDNLSLTRIQHVPGAGAGGDWRVLSVNQPPVWGDG